VRSLTALAAKILVRFSREEDTIAFASDLSKDGFRGARWVRDKLETLLFCRPANGCRVFNVIADELVRVVADGESTLIAAPTDAEGDVCGYRGATIQGVHKVVEVPGFQVAKVHRGRSVSEVDLYALIGDAYRPKQATRVNTGVVVVDFICKDKLSSLIKIQSDDAEGAGVLFPVHPNVDTLHETIVNVEDERSGGASTSVCSCPTTPYVCDAHESLKIEDRRLLGTMYGPEDVKNLRPWTKDPGAVDNGSWCDVIVLAGMRNCW
jgi:hypothetical protein